MLKTAFATLVYASAIVLALGATPASAADRPQTDSELGLTQPLDDSRPFTAVPAGPFEELNHEFDDVPTTHPFHPFVSWLAGRGITGGCGVRLFCPDAPLTRGEMSVFLKTNSLTGSPLAFGYVNAAGAATSGSGNFTVTWNAGSSWYEITIASHSYFFTSYTTVVTLQGSSCPGATVGTDSTSGLLILRVRNAANTAYQQCAFQFATLFNGI